MSVPAGSAGGSVPARCSQLSAWCISRAVRLCAAPGDQAGGVPDVGGVTGQAKITPSALWPASSRDLGPQTPARTGGAVLGG